MESLPKPTSRRTSRPASRPTLADVARVAGVAPMTVSRVLTGSASVKEPTADRVRKAVQMLRYQPNETARALRGNRSRNIGLIVPQLEDSFFATCAHAISEVAKRRGYSVLFTTSNDERDAESQQIQMMAQRGVEGLIIIPGKGYRLPLNLLELDRMRLVALDRPLEIPVCDSVLVQNREGTRLAVNHLLQHKYTEIVFCSGSSSIYTFTERREGYRDSMEEAGMRPNLFLTCNSTEEAVTFLQSQKKLRKRPLALFTANESAAIHCLRAATSLGLRVPEDLALICFDDFPLADIITPGGLTAIRQPLVELGRLAADMLFEQLEQDQNPHEGTTVSLPVDLMLRRSCGCKIKALR